MLDPVVLPVAIPTSSPCIEGGDALAAEAFGIALDEAERVLAGHIRRTRLELARHPSVFEN